MKNIGNNLSESLVRLKKLVDHLEGVTGGVGAIERDLLLQELREVYAEVLLFPIGEVPAAVVAEEEQEVPEFTFEPISEEEMPLAAEPEPEPDPVVEPDPIMEPEPIAEPVAMPEVEMPFAPAEPEEVEAPAPEPMMEELEGDPFGNAFEEEPEEVPVEEAPAEELPMEPEPEAKEPLKEDPIYEEPIKEEPVEEEPVKEEPVKEEPLKEAPEQKRAKPAGQPSLFDYLSASTQPEAPAAPTLADKIAQNRPNLEEKLEHRAMQHKVADLRQVIGINDKFLFMSELFHNNMKLYTDFILRLNALTTMEEAMEACSEAAAQNSWQEDSLAVRTFYKILERKF